MSDATKLAKARLERTRMIELLTICTCAYPIDRYRNRSGHHSECPAHKLYIELNPLDH